MAIVLQRLMGRKAALPICLLAVALGLVPGASAAPNDGASQMQPMGAVGRTVIAVIGVSGANRTVDAIGDSLALIHVRKQIEANPQPEPAPTPTAEEIAADPSKLPPASAGSNGTHVPHTSSLSREDIFAHSRGDSSSTAILLTGVALAPTDAPEAVRGAINAANTIIGRPYIWGGGHASFYSRGYDCSGSVSFALFGGGLIPEPLTSGELEHWGAPGPGKWITVYANAGHTFAEIAGLRWDTVGDAQGTGPRWHLAPTSTAGFVVRHPPGL
jgi:cell wall-associated NlpC family hydrolase